MFQYWVYLEADFHREYGLILPLVWEEGWFTWRFFLARLRGLGPDSAFNIMSNPDNQEEKVLDGDKYEKRAVSVLKQHGATVIQ